MLCIKETMYQDTGMFLQISIHDLINRVISHHITQAVTKLLPLSIKANVSRVPFITCFELEHTVFLQSYTKTDMHSYTTITFVPTILYNYNIW